MFETWFPRHWTTLKKLIWLRKTALGNAIKTVTGAIVTFVTSKAKPIVELIATFTPSQDLHGYDNPWPAGGGKNILDPGEIEIYGSTNIHCYYDDGFLLKANTAYTFSVSEAAAGLYFQKYSDSSNIATSYGKTFVTYTPTEDILIMLNAYYSGQYPAPSGGLSSVKCQLEIGSSATAWTPYRNICPISGHTGVTVTRTGKNLLPNKKVVRGSAREILVGQDSTSGYPILVKAGTSYTASNNLSRPMYYQRSGTSEEAAFSNGTTFTEDSYIKIWVYLTSSQTIDDLTWWQLELGSTASDYEVYRGNTYPISWQSEAGTVYSGTLEIKEDGSGVLTAKSATETYNGGNPYWSLNSGGVGRFYCSVLPSGLDTTKKTESICNQASYRDDNQVYGGYFAFGGSGLYVNKNSADETLDAFKTRISTNQIQIVYPLATPVTVPLTAEQISTLQGNNVVWVDDSDNISVTYYE